jgi:hypothetical protein
MDDRKISISPDVLYARLGSEAAPIIVDVRRDADFAIPETLVADVFHRSPDHVEQWRTVDGIWAFTGFDKTLSQARRIALWTKGHGVTRFDQIEIAPLP